MSHLRLRTAVFLGVVVALGLAMKLYAGPGRWWLNNWGASFAYECFFMGAVLLIVGSVSRIGTIAVGVCLGTCALEFLQLWQPDWLVAVRATFVGRSVLGHSFAWADLPAYPLGCLLGWCMLRRPAKAEGD
ncbi:MAG: DUF2809 domain-containing protein [Candidatus Krumholzibacteriota bacterium]|nr:DUF2809 domain-containing protein [Candidatus Krumholzibacteriota bacterium]